MKSLDTLLKSTLLVLACTMLVFACGSDDDSAPSNPNNPNNPSTPDPDLTENIVGTYLGTYFETDGNSVVNIDSVLVTVSKLTDTTIMVDGDLPGLGMVSLFDGLMADSVQFSNPSFVFGNIQNANCSGELSSETNLTFEILNPDNSDYQATYDGEKN